MAEADRGRHPGFLRFNVFADGPGILAERSANVGEGWPMDKFVNWFPFAIVGATLTVFGSLKLY